MTVPKPADPVSPALPDRLRAVEVPVTVVIGETTLTLGELGRWRTDTLVPLDRAASEPLRLCVNGRQIATAELCEGENGEGSLAVRILDLAGD